MVDGRPSLLGSNLFNLDLLWSCRFPRISFRLVSIPTNAVKWCTCSGVPVPSTSSDLVINDFINHKFLRRSLIITFIIICFVTLGRSFLLFSQFFVCRFLVFAFIVFFFGFIGNVVHVHFFLCWIAGIFMFNLGRFKDRFHFFFWLWFRGQ